MHATLAGVTNDAPHRDWLRGVLPTCALAVLDDGPAHGYALAQRIQAAGVGPVKGGALYPVLNRFEEEGLVTSTWQEGEGGPGRKVFTLTAEGRAHLADLRAGWPSFADDVAAVLGVVRRPSSGPPSAEPTTTQGER